jgi:hypothetical protein
MEFFLRHSVQTGSGAHPASHSLGTGGAYPRVKWPGPEADHSTSLSAMVTNAWDNTSILSIRPYGVMIN